MSNHHSQRHHSFSTRRSLPNTWALLDLMGFIDFPKYTAVGKNSGPNQSALYSGVPLDGRDIRSSTNATERIWLWDRFRDAGYVTMKAEDGCVSNSECTCVLLILIV